jgi:hypothetical protein
MQEELLELPAKKSEISVIADKINSGLAAFETRKAELMELKGEAEHLKITSIEDKPAIAKVISWRKKLKAARVEIEKEGKSMRDPLTQINKSISAKENELVEIIAPTEKALKVQEDWVEAEKARIQKEKDDAEAARIQARIDKLAEYGFQIDYVTITAISDADFERVLTNAKAEYEKEQAAIKERERLAAEEAARLKAEREELERLRAEQAEAQRIINENNARIAREQAEKEAEIQRREQEAKRAKEEAEARERQAERERLHAEQVAKAREEAAEAARLQAIEDVRIAAELKERQAKEAEAAAIREAALRPDKEKLQSFSTMIGEIKFPTVSDPAAQEIVNEVQILLNSVQAHIIKKIKSL